MTTIIDTDALDEIVTQAMRTNETWARYVNEVGVDAARAQTCGPRRACSCPGW